MCGWQVQADDEATAEPEAFAVRAELARLVQEVEDVKASHVLELADAEARSAATLQAVWNAAVVNAAALQAAHEAEMFSAVQSAAEEATHRAVNETVAAMRADHERALGDATNRLRDAEDAARSAAEAAGAELAAEKAARAAAELDNEGLTRRLIVEIVGKAFAAAVAADLRDKLAEATFAIEDERHGMESATEAAAFELAAEKAARAAAEQEAEGLAKRLVSNMVQKPFTAAVAADMKAQLAEATDERRAAAQGAAEAATAQLAIEKTARAAAEQEAESLTRALISSMVGTAFKAAIAADMKAQLALATSLIDDERRAAVESAAKAAADKIAAKKAARTDYVDGVADLAGRLVAANEAKAAAAATAFELQNALAAERDTLGRLQSDLAWAMRMVHQPRPQQAFIQPLQPQVDAAAQPGGPYVDMQGQQLFPVPNPPPPPPLMEARRIPVPAAPQGAPIIITPPHPEGLLCLREQQARDGAAPVGRPRGPAVVTRMPSAEELAQLRREVEARNAPAPEPQLVQGSESPTRSPLAPRPELARRTSNVSDIDGPCAPTDMRIRKRGGRRVRERREAAARQASQGFFAGHAPERSSNMARDTRTNAEADRTRGAPMGPLAAAEPAHRGGRRRGGRLVRLRRDAAAQRHDNRGRPASVQRASTGQERRPSPPRAQPGFGLATTLELRNHFSILMDAPVGN